MFEEVRNAVGANWFRAFVVVLGCLWVWHSFFGSVAEVGQAVNITYQGKNAERREAGTANNAAAQGENAAVREPAIAKGAVADAKTKEEQAKYAVEREKANAESAVAEAKIREATAQEALRRQKAEADAAVAEAKIREATAQETLRRQKAEADEAEARACSARMKAYVDNVPGNRIMDGYEDLARDCDPTRAKMRSPTNNPLDAPCFKDLQAFIDRLPVSLKDGISPFQNKLTEWKRAAPSLLTKKDRPINH